MLAADPGGAGRALTHPVSTRAAPVSAADTVSARAPATTSSPTWTWVTLPNVTDHPDSGLTSGPPPYTIPWPGEGTSATGEQDPACSATAPYRNGRRVRTGTPDPTSQLVGVLGIWKRGPFVRVGKPTPGAIHTPNHLAVFFHTPDLDGLPCYRGGAEYGFLRELADGSTIAGDQPLDFYQCNNCNCQAGCSVAAGSTVFQEYANRPIGWNDAEQDRIYRASFADFAFSSWGVSCTWPRDNLLIEVVDPANFKVIYSAKICRGSWMPDLKGASGWITANAHADRATSDGVDHFEGSYNQVTTVKWLHG